MERRQTAEVIKEPAKPADKKQAPLEKKPEALKKDQVLQRSNEIKEEAKNTKEVKEKENIKGGIKEELKASAEYRYRGPSLKSKYNNYSSIKEMTGRFGEEEVQQIVEQIEAIDLVKFLKAKGHPYFPKRIVDSKKIINTIEYWLQYLYCCEKNCPYNAIITYQGENSDQIYCQVHADPSKHMTERIFFQNELTESKPLLRELEKDLLYSQAEMIIAKGENEGDKKYESIIEDLENKFSVIKRTLNTMKGKVENLIEKPNTKKATNKNEVFRYRSLSFIKQDCEKCSEINDEILSIISNTSRKKRKLSYLSKPWITNAKEFSLMKNLRVDHILKSQMRYTKKNSTFLAYHFNQKSWSTILRKR